MAAHEDFDKELVVAYLLGTLSNADKLAFEQALEQRPELAAYTDDMRRLISTLKTGLTDDPGKEDLLATLHNNRNIFFEKDLNDSKEIAAPVRKIKNFPKMAWFAAAAALIAAIFLFWPQHAPFNEEWEQVNMMSFTERGNTTDSLLIAASAQFNQKQYGKALTLLNKVIEASPSHQTALFYRGVAAYITKNLTQSRKDLETVATGTSIFQYEAAYYLALSYATEKDTAAAHKWLNIIPAGTPMSEKAAHLKQQLK